MKNKQKIKIEIISKKEKNRMMVMKALRNFRKCII